MRSAALLPIAVVALSAVACKKKLTETQGEFPIKISISCTAEAVAATISPFHAKYYFPRLAVWTLDDASMTVSEFSIDKKPKGEWPYGGDLPYRGKRGEPAKGRGIAKNAEGKYQYSVSAICTPPGDTARLIVIDPDMIIIRGNIE